MPYRIGVRPGKSISLVGMAGGFIFVVLGLTVIMPLFGIFGLAWTAVAGCIALYHAYNFFSPRGVSAYEVNVGGNNPPEDFDATLRKLAKLREDGLVSEAEYEQKRAEVMRQRW